MPDDFGGSKSKPDYGDAPIEERSKPDYGDAPIEERFKKRMISAAQYVDRLFNGFVKGPKKIGFVLLVFPYGDEEGRCNYISNGAAREDIARMFEEQAKRFREDL